jgi:hypothetical protein
LVIRLQAIPHLEQGKIHLETLLPSQPILRILQRIHYPQAILQDRFLAKTH